VELDDFADLFNAGDWVPFDTNVYLETGAAESSELQARLFIKEENGADINLGKKKRKKNKEKNTDLSEIDQDDDYIDEDDL
jgi:hypothetical protein